MDGVRRGTSSGKGLCYTQQNGERDYIIVFVGLTEFSVEALTSDFVMFSSGKNLQTFCATDCNRYDITGHTHFLSFLTIREESENCWTLSCSLAAYGQTKFSGFVQVAGILPKWSVTGS